MLASLLHLQDAPLVDIVVRELRLPTALTGLAVGLAFGISGPLFQRMLGNPLASPDFVGVSSGASLFACAAIVTFHASGLVGRGREPDRRRAERDPHLPARLAGRRRAGSGSS